MSAQYILALDSGTSSNRAILFAKNGTPLGVSQSEFTQIYPHPGWVEHDAEEIWKSLSEVIQSLLKKTNTRPSDIAGIGITNQRETTVLWDRHTGKPAHNAIVWQDRRTAEICRELTDAGHSESIRKTTGLVVDAYFSATKIKWLLDNVPSLREKAERGDILFGTIDTWLIWNLSGGKLHITDYSNASRTMLYNIHEKEWDKTLLEIMRLPEQILPTVLPSSKVYGSCATAVLDNVPVNIAGIGGDQQAALFGQGCTEAGMAKNTYGTGCFILMHTGQDAKESKNGLLTTMACSLEGTTEYALEGSVFSAGSTIQWLRDELGIIKQAAETEELAMAVEDSLGVYFVPAFTGLGAPYWDMYARGTIVGLTRGANRKHIIRAGLESLCYQSHDVLKLMEQESAVPLHELRTDGGAAANNFIMQFQADISNVPVLRPKILETTALGAAFLSGLAVEFWQDRNSLKNIAEPDRSFTPDLPSEKRIALYNGWLRAVERARNWIASP